MCKIKPIQFQWKQNVKELLSSIVSKNWLKRIFDMDRKEDQHKNFVYGTSFWTKLKDSICYEC